MRNRPFVMVWVLLAVLSGGCATKHATTTPTPTAEPPASPVAAPPVAAPPAPPVTPPAAAAPDPLAGDLATLNRYVQEQGLLADVLFDFNRHALTDEACRRLEANARFLKERPQFQIALEGHADERGTVEYNIALGQKRATSARSYLDLVGVSRDRLKATSYGEERPLCTEQNESCWQRNRRVHFEIVGRIE